MVKPSTKPESSPRRRQVATVQVEAKQPISNPFEQCPCTLDIDSHYTHSSWLYHEDGSNSVHLPSCPLLRAERLKTSQKRKSQSKSAPSLDLEEDEEKDFRHTVDIRNGNTRRQRKEAKRAREAGVRAEAMIVVQTGLDQLAQCYCYGPLSDSEDEVARDEMRTIKHTHTNGSTSLHLPNCPVGRSDSAVPRRSRTSLPKSTPYIDLEETEEEMTKVWKRRRIFTQQEKEVMTEARNMRLKADQEKEQEKDHMTEVRKRKEHTLRQRKEERTFKSASYIDLEEQEGQVE